MLALLNRISWMMMPSLMVQMKTTLLSVSLLESRFKKISRSSSGESGRQDIPINIQDARV